MQLQLQLCFELVLNLYILSLVSKILIHIPTVPHGRSLYKARQLMYQLVLHGLMDSHKPSS